MTSRKFIISILLALLGLATLPSLASALTITVDDDRVQCPLADETSLTAAVAAAANGDTVKICAGTYNVPGGPAPSSGLKIEKNISLAGAGSDKVFVQPVQGSGSIAQATPNPRDEYGNVITVRRRLIELYDVSISGLTVRAGDVPVEAGIAMIDVVTGTISSVKVEGIVPMTPTPPTPSVPLPGTGPYAPEIESVPNPLSQYGNAVIVANTIEQTQNTTTITGSQFSQFNGTGILVDSRRLSGNESVGNKSTITANIVNTRVTGAGGVQPIPQTGLEAWGSGATVKLTKSKISGVGRADGSAAAIEMHGIDLAGSVIGGSEADRNDLTANAYGATNVAFDGSPAAANLKAGGNFWGTTSSAGVPLAGPNVGTEPTMPSAPAATTLAPIADQIPTVEWDVKPVEGTVFAPGTSIPLAAVAGDDFGVRTVEFRVNGGTVSTAPTPPLLGERVYKGSWVPTQGYSGEATISAVAVDSNNQTSEVKVAVIVEGKPHFTSAPTITGYSGYASVGKPLTCSSGTAAAYPAPTYSYAWTVGGVAVGTDSPAYTPVAADQGKKVVCTVKASNPFGSVVSATGQVPVAKEPAFASPATITGGNTSAYAQQGKVLNCTAGAVSGEPTPGTATVAWTRDGTQVATTAGYTVVAADVGHTLTCTYSSTSSTGTGTTSASILAGSPAVFGGSPGTLGGTSSGYAVVGKALTCASGSPGGAPAPTVAYAWSADGAPVGTNSPTYVPTAADQGKSIVCEVTATNPISSVNGSGAPVKVGTIPAFDAAASISGSSGAYGSPGDALTCSAAADGDPTPSVSYAWFRDATQVATGAAYEVSVVDAGHELKCTATATSLAGSSASSATLGIGSAPKEGAPLLSGAAKVGSTLTCEPGSWTAIPKAGFTYAWLRNGAPIAGATGATYATRLADVGAAITCEVTASNELGSGKAASTATRVAAAPPLAAKLQGALGGKFASLAKVTCDLGPCTVTGPKEVKVGIGRVAFKLKLIYPGKLAGGAAGTVKIKLTTKAREALKLAGKSGKFSVKLTIAGGGSSSTEAFSLRLKAPKK